MDPFPSSSMRFAIFLITTILCFCCPISFSATSCISLLSDAAWTGPSTISDSFCCFPDDILLLPSSPFSCTEHIIVVVPGLFSIEHLRKLASGSTGTKMETFTPAGHCITFTADDSVNTAMVIFIQDMEIIQRNLFYNSMVVLHCLQAFQISTTSLSLPLLFHPDHRSGTSGAMVLPAVTRLMSRDVILEDLAMKLLILSTRAPVFDFYKRADQWPMGVCVASPGQCILPILPTHFTLHGLWPSNKGGRKKQPKFCSPSSHWDPMQIDDLMPRLQYGWPGLLKPNDEFWGHEWSKHGTCSSLQEHDYFKLALDLYETQNLTSILEDAGVTPGPTASYPAKKFTDAILASEIGVEPDLVCKGQYLVEIRICLDVTATVYQQCPQVHSPTCLQQQDIIFVA